MLYYPYKVMFSAYNFYKSVIVTPCTCDLFEVTKIPRYMDVSFCWSFFSAFSVCDDYLELNHSLAEIICTIYSFIHARTQHF